MNQLNRSQDPTSNEVTDTEIDERFREYKQQRRLEEFRAIAIFSILSAVIIGAIQWLN